MSLETHRDHHSLRIEVPVQREPFRRTLGILVGLGLVAAIAGDPLARGGAAALLLILAVLLPDRRRATLLLDHDTLAVQTTWLGRDHEVRAPWDRVEIGVEEVGTRSRRGSRSRRGLDLGIGGAAVWLPWSGSNADLAEALDLLRRARDAYVPGVEEQPPPESLARIRDLDREAR